MTLFKAFFFRLVSLLFGLVAGFLFAEIITRVASFGTEAFSFKKTDSFVSIGYSGFIRPAEDQFVWYELLPNLDAWFKMKPIQTNSRGLRDREYAIKKPPGTYRVAVIGDSFTFGDGVCGKEVWHAILEERLNQLSDSLHFEFINFGLAGYDLLNYLGVIEQKAMAWDPDLILIGFCGNNDDDLPEPRQWTEPFTGYKYVEYSWFVRHFQVIRTVANFIGIQRRKNGEESGNKHAEKAAFVTKMFSEFRRVREIHEVPFLVCYLSMADAPPSKAALVKKLCAEHEFAFVDSSPRVDSIEDISRYWFHSSDHHPNAEMHVIYSDVLLKFFVEVRERWGLVP